MKSRVLILVLAIGALVLPHCANAACPAGRSATTAAKLNCIVNATFASAGTHSHEQHQCPE